jgi:hypothetical protein
MRYVRYALLWVSSIFLHVSLLLFVVSMSLILVFDQDTIKENLVSSNIYQDVVPAIIADNVKQTEGVSGSLPVNDPEIQRIALESFSQSVLQQQTESAINGFYAWLDGTQDKLQFDVSLKDSARNFIDNVSIYAATRLSDKPVCTTEDVTQITVFDLPCRPEDIPLSYIRDIAQQNLESSNLFKDMQWTEEDLPKTQDGTPVQVKYSYIPMIYQTFVDRVYVFIGLLAISVVSFVAVRKPLRRGFKALGKDLLSNSVVIIAATILFGFLLPRITQSATLQTAETTKLFTNVTDTFVQSFDTLVINIMLQVAAIAVVIIAIERMSRPSSMYGSLRKKSGMVSSTSPAKRTPTKTGQTRTRPPVQTSEVTKKNKSNSTKTKKYRKIGL